MILTVLVGATIFYKMDPTHNLPPLPPLTGGFLSPSQPPTWSPPVTRGGMILFGIGCGLITSSSANGAATPKASAFDSHERPP